MIFTNYVRDSRHTLTQRAQSELIQAHLPIRPRTLERTGRFSKTQEWIY